jgi:Transposase DDE domain group 1
VLVNLAGHTPLLRDADRVMFVDVDDTVKPTYGYAKQGAGYGYTHVKGLNALLGTLSTPTSAPVIAATRLRKGSTSSPRGAASFVASTLATARRCGASGLVLARMDSAFYTADVVAAIGRAGARFSITARLNASVKAAISLIPEDGWTPIHYPNAVWDDQAGRWVSDAEVAETSYTAFASVGQPDR